MTLWRRPAPRFVAAWLLLSAFLAAEAAFLGRPKAEENGATNESVAAGASKALAPEVRGPAPAEGNDLDRALEAVSASAWPGIVEDALLNGRWLLNRDRSQGDSEQADIVTFTRDAEPYDIHVTFLRSSFPRAAPGVVGPFCGTRVEYDLSLFEGDAAWTSTRSRVRPVVVELACDRAERSRNARHFRERAARSFLTGNWAFALHCHGESYAMNVRFFGNDPLAPSLLGNVERLSIDGIEEVSFLPQMEARRDRDSGRLDLEFGTDSRGLRGKSTGFILSSGPVDETSGLLGGEARTRQDGGVYQPCGTWTARKSSDRPR